jgi:hypothetical protein
MPCQKQSRQGAHGLNQIRISRYCDEFSFRWCGRKISDAERRDLAVVGIEGKRLYLYQPRGEDCGVV